MRLIADAQRRGCFALTFEAASGLNKGETDDGIPILTARPIDDQILTR
jgi:hypothetical protein